MRFSKIAWLTAALFSAVPVHAEPVSPPDPVALGYAKQVVDTILPPARQGETVTNLMQAMMTQMRGVLYQRFDDPGLRQIIDAHLNKSIETLRPVNERRIPLIMDAMTQAYVREFSLDELRQISEFAKSPTGSHYLSRSTALVSDPAVVAANQAYMLEASRATQASESELRQTITDYLTKHPEVARKMKQREDQKSDH